MFVLEPVVGESDAWGATLCAPDGGRLPLRFARLTDTPEWPDVLDGVVAAVLPRVMRAGGLLRVAGPVTRGAVRNLTEYAEAWSSWAPDRFARVPIVADAVVDGRRAPRGHRAVVAWSGSLRATHTLVRHRDGAVPGAFAVAAVLRVVGLHRRDADADAAAATTTWRRALAPEGVPLRAVRIDVAGGLRDLEIGALPLVAAALHATASDVPVGLHARSWLVTAQLRYPRPGPALHDLLGGDACAVRADGGTTSPPAMAAAVARHPALAAVVSDCARRSRLAPACGRCARCTLLRLARRAAALPAPRPRLARIATLPLRDPTCAADVDATLATWTAPRDVARALLASRARVARAAVEARDTARWLAAAAGARAPWPR